jgi:ABC-type Na+ efflux pump permease subunit
MLRTALTLARKDLRMLARTRVLLALLVIYPLVITAILGAILLHQGPPSIAYVNEDKTGDVVQIGADRFSVSSYIHQAEGNGVNVVQTDRSTAERMLAEGQVAGVLIVPQGTVARLQTQLAGANLEFEVGDSAIGGIVAQRMQGIIYSINLRISEALIQTNRSYLNALVTGGKVDVAGRQFQLYGLRPAGDTLTAARAQLAASGADAKLLGQFDATVEFARLASAAIGLADNALEATAAPVRISVQHEHGKSSVLTAQAISFALAAAISFVCIVLVAASLAGERDEAVLGRLLRGLASARSIVLGKLLLGAGLALAFTAGLFVVFGILAPQAWARLPLLLGAVVLTSAACSGIGALIAVLARDARTATLAGILLVLPLVPLSLVSLHGWGGRVESIFPVAPSRRLFNAVLFDASPWHTMLTSGGALLASALVTSWLAARLLRRLV